MKRPAYPDASKLVEDLSIKTRETMWCLEKLIRSPMLTPADKDRINHAWLGLSEASVSLEWLVDSLKKDAE